MEGEKMEPISGQEKEGIEKLDVATEEEKVDGTEDELHRLLLPDPQNLPPIPPSAVDANFVKYFAPDFMKPGHDMYVYRHANGLCVVGIASTHISLREEDGGVKCVDFNVGKTDRSLIKVMGKRKKNAQRLESNSVLCKVSNIDNVYGIRSCVKGSLLEVNERLIKHPQLLNSAAEREGYVAIMMPKPADWLKVKDTFINLDDYKKLRNIK